MLSGEPRLFEGGLFQSELWPADILQHHQLTDRGVPLWRQHHQTGSDSGRPHTGEPVFDAYTGSVALSWLYRTFQQSAERAGVGGICEKRHRRKFTDYPWDGLSVIFSYILKLFSRQSMYGFTNCVNQCYPGFCVDMLNCNFYLTWKIRHVIKLGVLVGGSVRFISPLKWSVFWIYRRLLDSVWMDICHDFS